MTSARSSAPRRLLRAGVALAAAAGTLMILALSLVPRPAAGPAPASIAPAASAGDAGFLAPGQPRFPELDPEPWTRVDWRVVPGAITAKPVIGLDRIDGLVAGGPGLIGWGRVSQPNRNQFNDMGAIHLSANGVAWRVVALDAGVAAADTSEFRLVAAGPMGILVIGGVCCTVEERSALWRSVDGITWERLPYPAALAAAQLTRLIATADRYLVTGQLNGQAAIWSSADGVSWEAAGGEPFARGSVEDVALTAAGLIAVGRVEDGAGLYDGAVWTSPEGLEWTPTAVPALVGEPDVTVTRVVPWTGGLFLAGREGDHDERIRCEQAAAVGPIEPIRPGSRDFSCGWGGEVHWVSRNRVDWQRVVPAGEFAAPKPRTGDLIEFRLLAAGGPGLINLGEGLDDGGATIWVSKDGIDWQATQPKPQWAGGVLPAGFVVRDRTIVGVGDGPTVQIGTVR